MTEAKRPHDYADMLSHNFSLFQCHIYNYNNTYFSTIKNTDFNSTMINYCGNCMVTQHIMILEFITSKFISKATLELPLLWSFFAHLDKLYTYPGIHEQNCIAEGRKDNIRDRVSLNMKDEANSFVKPTSFPGFSLSLRSGRDPRNEVVVKLQ